MKTLKYAQTFEVIAELPEHLKKLTDLAMNFRWTWHLETQQVFQEVDPQLWEKVEHNPIHLLKLLPKERHVKLGNDKLFLSKLEHCYADLQSYLSAGTWFDESYPGMREQTKIAYFCAEFGLNESFPIYSGGLGLLAGDHLKAASDIGLPLVGVGLLYSRGYFRQYLSDDGWQRENYPRYDFYGFPIHLVRGADDQPLNVSIELPDRIIRVQVWKAKVGRIELYLLDSNILGNEIEDQGITDTLYGGDEHMRIRQEMVLGIGGLKVLEAMGIPPTVCHMNEGHAAFLTLERLRQFIEKHNCDLKTARQVTVSGNVFTTHTPVPAGFDVFTPEMLKRYMGSNINKLGIDFEDFLKLGRINPENPAEMFNMAVLAMENANHVNGVSKLHAAVSREMFSSRWPSLPENEVPIEAITNGIHTMSWMGYRMAELLDRQLGPAWRDNPSSEDTWQQASEIPAAELWELRENSRADLIRFARKRMVKSLQRRNAGRAQIAEASSTLDPRTLTIGFARRFATYKRASLLFSDKERLRNIIFHPERPVQFIFAGKSHPKDDGGKKLIQDIVHFINQEGGNARMVFLEDYDIEVGRALVQGCDVWLNTPRRPMEASGTSGMKVVPNGGLNCSILDGWWPEGYRPGVGWAIGNEIELPDQNQQDWLDSHALYAILESEIAPMFYNRNEEGVPTGWVTMMRASMAELAPLFSTDRMVREYADRFYMPSHKNYMMLEENGLSKAKEALEWRKRIRSAWPNVKVMQVANDVASPVYTGAKMTVRAHVSLAGLGPDDVQVELLIGEVGPDREIVNEERIVMKSEEEKLGMWSYSAEIDCERLGHMGYVVRVVPKHNLVNVASELGLVAWQMTS